MAEKKIPFDQRKKYNQKGKRRRNRFRIFKILFLACFLLLLAAGGATAAVVAGYVNETPPIDMSLLETVETSYLFDNAGNEITSLHEEQNRIAISLEDIPLHVRQAFIAIEDERFDSHFGFDVTASLRAAYINLRAGSIVQGASTITQQLAQNAFLTTETSYERKIQEIWLAIQLERIFSKNEILEMYLNRIYFGNGAYGLEAASQVYFDKSVSDLNVNEGAMLAGTIRSPNFYNPFNNRAEAEARMRIVLSNMHRLEHIGDQEYQQALNHRLRYGEPKGREYPYPHYVDYVVHNELIRILSSMPAYGSREEAYRAIYTGGLRVYTNLDKNLQEHVESILRDEELYPFTYTVDMNQVRAAIAELPRDTTLSRAQLEELVVEENGLAQPQAAIVLSDPATGRVMALGGGREYQKNIDEVLRFTTLRQPGSAIKPIITYAPAFEEGVLAGAGATLDDSPFKKPEENWYPENFDYKFRGMLSVRESLFKSYNIPAVRAFEMLGPEKGVDYLERMGISTIHPDEKTFLSLTLGGLTRGVSALEMNQAYSVLANNGLKVDLHTVESIVDRRGNIIYEYNTNPEQILSPQSTFLVNDILQDYVTNYLGTALQIDRPVAAKTGTTDEFRDVYLVAYTPNMVASFWMGYDEPRMGQLRDGWRFSTAFLREVFLEAFEGLEVMEFEQPDGIVRMTVCSRSGLLPNEDCERADSVISDYFLSEYRPTETCDMHEGRFYIRPPYIETDERWSSRGGPGRKPLDVEDMDTRIVSGGFEEARGSTTDEITSFRANLLEEGITLQWVYDGPAVSAFELTRTTRREEGSAVSYEIDGNTRQFTDEDIAPEADYTYTLSARYQDGSLSDPARINIRIRTTSDGEIIRQPSDDMVEMPDVTGIFQAFAESQISRQGLVTGSIVHRYDDEIPRNRVIDQRPDPGTFLEKGSEVRLIISRGPEP